MSGLLILASLLALAPQGNLGKSDAEILAMGYDRWFKLYTQENGDSTAGMVAAMTSYGEAEKRRNDRWLKPKPAATRARVNRLRASMTEFANAGISAAQNLSGGGTIWNLSYGGVLHRVEETLYFWLSGTGSAAKPLKFHRIATAIAKSKAYASNWPHADRPWKSAAIQVLSKAEAVLVAIVKEERFLPRSAADRISGFCARYADIEALMVQ